MKKVLLSLLALSTVALVACGPSKTYVAVESASTAAMEQLNGTVDSAALVSIQTTWTEAIVAAEAEAPLTGEEATKAGELKASVATSIAAKADSLAAVAAQVAMEQAAAAAAAQAEAEAAQPKKK